MTPDEDAMRAAARELIAAGRSFLDAAEALLDDPAATERVVGVVSVIAQQAQRVAAGVANDMTRGTQSADEGA
jgi:hypothetical protein